MSPFKIIVACGNGVATSQLVAYRLSSILKRKGVLAKVEAINIRSLNSELNNADLYVEIMKTDHIYKVPKIDGLCFLTKENEEAKVQEIIKLIKEKENEKSNRCLW